MVPDNRSDAQSGHGFSLLELPLHTDRSSTPQPPRFLGLYLAQQPDVGGVPKFADLRLAFAGLSQHDLEQVNLVNLRGRSRPLVLASENTSYRYRDDPWWTLSGPTELTSTLRDAVAINSYTVPWLRTGDAYILDNHRVVHGRTELLGTSRVAMRILADGTL